MIWKKENFVDKNEKATHGTLKEVLFLLIKEKK